MTTNVSPKSRSTTKVFTDRGLYMLATILKGDKARDVTFAIIETFAKVRELKRELDLLRRMSSVEARIIDYACKNCTKFLYPNKLISAQGISVPFEKLVLIAKTDDIYRLDSELDHMRSIELLNPGYVIEDGGGFTVNDISLEANITPSPLALSLYFKTHSQDKTPIEFWGDTLKLYSVAEAEAKTQAEMDQKLSQIFEGDSK